MLKLKNIGFIHPEIREPNIYNKSNNIFSRYLPVWKRILCQTGAHNNMLICHFFDGTLKIISKAYEHSTCLHMPKPCERSPLQDMNKIVEDKLRVRENVSISLFIQYFFSFVTLLRSSASYLIFMNSFWVIVKIGFFLLMSTMDKF